MSGISHLMFAEITLITTLEICNAEAHSPGPNADGKHAIFSSMTWNLIRLADVEAAPWRNGGGVTRELALGPSSEAWSWRMSVAEVSANGPFSRFDGVTRWFAVLRGAGVVLAVPTPADDADSVPVIHRLTRHDSPLSFDGAALTQCQLLNGPTQDFNLMVRDPCLSARMVRVTWAVHELVSPNSVIAVYAVDSMTSVRLDAEHLHLPPATLAWRSVTKAAVVQVQSDHAMWMELSA